MGVDVATENVSRPVSRGAENFSIDFHRSVAGKTDGNFVSSALSAHLVLSMTAYGAEGTTAQEMKESLHLPENETQAHRGFQGFIDALNSVEKVVLKIANKIYAAQDVNVKDKFKEITTTYFRSESDLLDFSKAAESANAVNKWCNEKTNGKINKLLDAGDISGDTRMILLNAVYFKGNWKYKFDEKLTSTQLFHINKTTTVDVPMMHIKKKFFYKDLENVNAECIGLSYENEDLAMLIIVPREVDGLPNVEGNLEKIQLDYEKDFKTHTREIQLSLPKFKVETTTHLNPHLNTLGMTEMFTSRANFKGIADEPLAIDKVIQKAFIEVNEEGSEAAAVTGITMMCYSMPLPPYIVNVDKPFLYKIVYRNNTIFSGRITNPLAN